MELALKPNEPAPVYVAPPGKHQPSGHSALFNLGFRPFYLCGAACAAIALVVWLLVLGGVPLTGGYLMRINPVGWHAHEMVFGFAASIVAGFLLTAVRAWTGRDTIKGAPLAALAALWLVARVLVWSGPAVPAAIVDSAFLPIAALVLLRVLVKAGNRRNYFLVPVLMSFGALDAAFHFFTISGRADLAMRCLYAAAGIVVLLVSVIAGRVLPMFTANAIPGFVARRWRPVELAVAPVTALALFADAAGIDARVVGVLAVIACATHVARLIGWRSYLRAPPADPRGAASRIRVDSARLRAARIERRGLCAAYARDARVHGGRDRRRDHRDDHAHRARTHRPSTRRRSDAISRAMRLSWRARRCACSARSWRRSSTWLWIWSAGACWALGFAIYVAAYARPLCRPRADGKPG